MDLKILLLLTVVILAVMLTDKVDAEFYYNHVWPKADELETYGLKCVPGRTIIVIEQMKVEPPTFQGSGDEDEDPIVLRTHMNTKIKEEYCKICVCSVEGKDEYCSGRPAMNVNECLRMNTLMQQFESNVPYEHSRTLSSSIRRVGGDDVREDSCVPFISEYTDCTAENQCNGCNKCLCIADGKWSCSRVRLCPGDDPEDLDYSSINTAIDEIQNNLVSYSRIKAFSSKTPYVPQPAQRDQDLLLGYVIGVPK